MSDDLQQQLPDWKPHLEAVLTFVTCAHETHDEAGNCLGCGVIADAYEALRREHGYSVSSETNLCPACGHRVSWSNQTLGQHDQLPGVPCPGSRAVLTDDGWQPPIPKDGLVVSEATP